MEYEKFKGFVSELTDLLKKYQFGSEGKFKIWQQTSDKYIGHPPLIGDLKFNDDEIDGIYFFKNSFKGN